MWRTGLPVARKAVNEQHRVIPENPEQTKLGGLRGTLHTTNDIVRLEQTIIWPIWELQPETQVDNDWQARAAAPTPSHLPPPALYHSISEKDTGPSSQAYCKVRARTWPTYCVLVFLAPLPVISCLRDNPGRPTYSGVHVTY